MRTFRPYIKRIFLFLILIVGLQIKPYSVFAEEGLSNVTFKANVPPEFQTNIMVNLYYVKDTNVNLSLTKNNSYECTLTLEKGEYVLDFVNFYGDLNNQFTHNFKGIILIADEYQDIKFDVFENVEVSNKGSNDKDIKIDGQMTVEKIVGIAIAFIFVIGFLKKIV